MQARLQPAHARSTTPPAPASGTGSGRPIGRAAELLLIAAGGACGAIGRALATALLGALGAAGATSTHVVNAIGAFALGVLLARLERAGPRPRLRAFLAVGGLGSFTTFSTLVADAHARTAAAPDDAPLRFLLLFTVLTAALAGGLVLFELGRRCEARMPRVAPARRTAR